MGRLAGAELLAATEAAAGVATVTPAAWGGLDEESHSPTEGKEVDTQPRAMQASSDR